jgi:hypothetical protein
LTPYERGQQWFENQPWARQAWFHKQVREGTYEWRMFFQTRPTPEYMRGVNHAYESWQRRPKAQPRPGYTRSKELTTEGEGQDPDTEGPGPDQ